MIILLHSPNKNFWNNLSWKRLNSILRKITGLGAYAKQAILNCFRTISFLLVQDMQFGSNYRHGPSFFLCFDLLFVNVIAPLSIKSCGDGCLLPDIFI